MRNYQLFLVSFCSLLCVSVSPTGIGIDIDVATTKKKAGDAPPPDNADLGALLTKIRDFQHLCTIQDMITNHHNLPGSNLRLFLFWAGIKLLTRFVYRATSLHKNLDAASIKVIADCVQTVKKRQAWGATAQYTYGNGWGTEGVQGWRIRDVYRITGDLLRALQQSPWANDPTIAQVNEAIAAACKTKSRSIPVDKMQPMPFDALRIMAKIDSSKLSGTTKTDQTEYDMYDVDGGPLHRRGKILPAYITSYDSYKYFQQMLMIGCMTTIGQSVHITDEPAYNGYGIVNTTELLDAAKILKERMAWSLGSGTFTSNWKNPQLFLEFGIMTERLKNSDVYGELSEEDKGFISTHELWSKNKIEQPNAGQGSQILIVIQNMLDNKRPSDAFRQALFGYAITQFAQHLITMIANKEQHNQLYYEQLEQTLTTIYGELRWKSWMLGKIDDPTLLRTTTDALQQIKTSPMFKELSSSAQKKIDYYLALGTKRSTTKG